MRCEEATKSAKMLKISSALIFLGVSTSIFAIPVQYANQDVKDFNSNIAVSKRKFTEDLEGRCSTSCIRKQLHNILAHDLHLTMQQR